MRVLRRGPISPVVRRLFSSISLRTSHDPVFVLTYPGSRVLTLSSPDSGNELSARVTISLEEKLKQYASNESVSAVFFASRSPDVFSTSSNNSIKGNLQALSNFVTTLSTYSKPTLAVYSGSMNGTGFAAFSGAKYLLGGPSFSLISDELCKGRLPSAGFAFQFTKCGKYGVAMARYLAVSQREVRADDMFNLGMLTHLVEDEAYVSLADALSHTIPSKAAANRGAVVIDDAIDDLLQTMHIEDITEDDPLSHEAWDKLVLVPPNREDTRDRNVDDGLENDLFSLREDVYKCFNGTPEMAIKKLSEINKPWSLDAIEKISAIDRSLLNTWWKVTESISFPGIKLVDILRQETSESRS